MVQRLVYGGAKFVMAFEFRVLSLDESPQQRR
jgi:hypothetical protein